MNTRTYSNPISAYFLGNSTFPKVEELETSDTQKGSEEDQEDYAEGEKSPE